MKRITDIINGWANLGLDQFNLLDDDIKNISATRLEICNVCPIRQNNTCSTKLHGTNVKTGEVAHGCGCNLSAKTLVKGSECPLGKW
tara:strand:+ start:212 stop:472 length:261 start_codon:yes stop_codon:yes gene_type:complete